MSKFGSKEEIIRAIESQFELMQTSKLSKDDLELLVEQTRELYERALILRHKAYEELVFGEFDAVSSEILIEEIEEEELEESFVEEQEDDFIAENSTNSVSDNSTNAHSDLFASQETAFDFDVFNETPSENVAEIVYEENEEMENEGDSFHIETETLNEELDEEINELSIQEFEEELETIENESDNYRIEHSELTNSDEEIDDNKQEIDVFASSEFFADEETSTNSFNLEENASEIETNIENQLDNHEIKVEHSIGNSMFKEILEADDARGSLMLSGKLITLVGSFGFNEKIQSIQELFKNSSEDFNQALDVLDNLQNFQEAQNQLEYYVHLNNWNLKSEIVAEFVRKVERRFR